jgi:hypothetical protein
MKPAKNEVERCAKSGENPRKPLTLGVMPPKFQQQLLSKLSGEKVF